MRVQRRQVQRVAEDRHAPIVGPAAHPLLGRDAVAVDPEHTSRLGVKRQDVIRALRDVHDPVDDNRRRLPGAGHLVLEHPLLLEILDVRRVDLAERGEALARVPARIGQTVLRFVRRAQQTIEGDLRTAGCCVIGRQRQEDERQRGPPRRLHHG